MKYRKLSKRLVLGICKAALLGLAVGLGVIAAGETPRVSAQSSQYPYADMPCIWAPYASEGNTAQWCADYDWGTIRGSTAAASVISPYGYYYRNCTDYAAWRVSMLGVDPARYRGLGNAKDWAARALLHGVRVDGTPAAGSVAVRTSGTYGHTAFVEEVNPAGLASGTIKISQFNHNADGNYSEKYGSPTSFGFVAFVHFEDFAPQHQPVAAGVAVLGALLPPGPPEPELPVPQPAPAALKAEPPPEPVPISEAAPAPDPVPAALSSDPPELPTQAVGSVEPEVVLDTGATEPALSATPAAGEPSKPVGAVAFAEYPPPAVLAAAVPSAPPPGAAPAPTPAPVLPPPSRSPEVSPPWLAAAIPPHPGIAMLPVSRQGRSLGLSFDRYRVEGLLLCGGALLLLVLWAHARRPRW